MGEKTKWLSICQLYRKEQNSTLPRQYAQRWIQRKNHLVEIGSFLSSSLLLLILFYYYYYYYHYYYYYYYYCITIIIFVIYTTITIVIYTIVIVLPVPV